VASCSACPPEQTTNSPTVNGNFLSPPPTFERTATGRGCNKVDPLHSPRTISNQNPKWPPKSEWGGAPEALIVPYKRLVVALWESFSLAARQSSSTEGRVLTVDDSLASCWLASKQASERRAHEASKAEARDSSWRAGRLVWLLARSPGACSAHRQMDKESFSNEADPLFGP